MSIDSCDHGDFVVVYEIKGRISCPVCEKDEEIDGLEEAIKNLKENEQ